MQREQYTIGFIEALTTSSAGGPRCGTWRWIIRPSTLPDESLPRLTLLALLLLRNLIIRPVGAASALAETLVSLLVREDLLHLQRRDGTKDRLRVHELLVGEHLTEVGGVNPARLLELVFRIFVLGVSHNLGELDVVAVGVVNLRRLGLRCVGGFREGDLALCELRVSRSDRVHLRLLRRSLSWAMKCLIILALEWSLGGLSRINWRYIDAVSILDRLHP